MEKVNVYIVSLKDGRFYCGITNNIARRFTEHTQGLKSWASKQGVIRVEYIRIFDSRKQAARMERKIKVFGVKKYYQYLQLYKKDKF